jgi:hypothetical protein
MVSRVRDVHVPIGARIGLATLALATIALSPPAAPADELQSGGRPSGFTVHDAGETLRSHCRTDAEGRLWLEIPGGARFELITSTADPDIANPGDGAFHPFDAVEVDAALAQVDFDLDGVRADVFMLPYPRRHGLDSAAGPGVILLSPGVRAVSREQQHAEVTHELGHVVQYALMPDDDVARWNVYRSIRGISDAATFSAASVHANRPHEIFAEDFRVLFGGPTANYSGTIENAALADPRAVPGLRSFILGFARPVTAGRLEASPNPARGALRFRRAGATEAPLDVFDAQGRRVATLAALPGAAGTEWSWTGADVSRVAAGHVLYARVRDGAGDTARIVVVR